MPSTSVMVPPVAAAVVPAIVMTAIAVPAVMAMPAAFDLNDGVALRGERRHSQPRRSGAGQRQHQQTNGQCIFEHQCAPDTWKGPPRSRRPLRTKTKRLAI